MGWLSTFSSWAQKIGKDAGFTTSRLTRAVTPVCDTRSVLHLISGEGGAMAGRLHANVKCLCIFPFAVTIFKWQHSFLAAFQGYRGVKCKD